jgi:hypothetical protein
MMLAAALRERFGIGELVEERGRIHAEVPWGGARYRVRLEMAPVGRIVVGLPSTDGFELAVRARRRPFALATNDPALARVWLDEHARIGLRTARACAWWHEIANDEVSARRADAERDPGRMIEMVSAALEVASRPVRWAQAFARAGQAIGGAEAARRIELGGRPALRVRRAAPGGAVDVVVRVVRRLGPGDPGRLRTVVRAHGRAGVLGELTFEGALVDPLRLGPAIELAAHGAIGGRSGGPYR